MPARDDQRIVDETGQVVTQRGCGDLKTDLYWEESNPTRSTVRQEGTFICANTGMPPATLVNTEGQVEAAPCDGQEASDQQIAQDPLLDYYCVTCPRVVAEDGKKITEGSYRIMESETPRQYGD
jgi:hypothetical protein